MKEQSFTIIWTGAQTGRTNITARSNREAFSYLCGIAEGFRINGKEGISFYLVSNNGKVIKTKYT